MKRYFNNMALKQTIMFEFEPNSCFRAMDISAIFGTNKDIVEITKSQYRRISIQYGAENVTNVSMTINH